jgi:hypothetical protein
MKALVLFVFVAVAQGFSAQETQSPPSRPNPDSASQTATQPVDQKSEYSPGVGTIIVAELSNAVNAKKAKIGDRVECTVVTDLIYQGKVVVPRYAKVVGHITAAEPFTKEHHESRLGLTFDKIILKNKKELSFQGPAIVVALAPPVQRTVRTTTEVRDMPIEMQRGGQTSPGGPSGGSSTGSSILSAVNSNPNLVGGNMGSNSGAIGAADRGVIGWPGVFLLKGDPGTTVIASPKETVDLMFQAQVVLRVMEPNK